MSKNIGLRFLNIMFLLIFTYITVNQIILVNTGGLLMFIRNILIMSLFIVTIYLFYSKFLIRLKTWKFKVVFSCVFIVGLLLRLFWLKNILTEPISDFNTFYTQAKEIMQGKFYSCAEHGYFYKFPHLIPYTVLLSKIFKLFGDSINVVKAFNIIFSSISAIIIYLIGKEIKDKYLGLLAMALFAIHPASITYTSVMATENFAIPFVLLSVLFIFKAINEDDNKYGFVVLSGIALGLGHLLRGVGLILFIAYFIYIIIYFRNKKAMKSLSIFFVCFISAILAFNGYVKLTGITIRDIWEKASPIEISILIGTNFESNGMWNPQDHEIYEKNNGNKEDIKKEARQLIKQRLTDPNNNLVKFFNKKVQIQWNNGLYDGIFWSTHTVSETTTLYDNINEPQNLSTIYKVVDIYYLMLLILTLCGTIFSLFTISDNKYLDIIRLFFMGLFGMLLIIEVQPRYTFIISPMLNVLAAYGIYSMKTYIETLRGEVSL